MTAVPDYPRTLEEAIELIGILRERFEQRGQFVRGLGETMRQAVLALQAVEERIRTAQRHAGKVGDTTLVPLDLGQLLLDVQQVIHNLQMGMPR